MNSLSLHAQFDVIKLKLHLRKYPENSYSLAIRRSLPVKLGAHFQDYLEVVERYKQLQEENKRLKSISLPPMTTPSHGQLQRKYDELLKAYQELMKHHSNLFEENDALLVLLENDSPLPSSLKRRQVT